MHPVFESIETFAVEEFELWLRQREQAGDIAHYELLNGRIVMTPPAGWPHGSVEGNLVGELRTFVKPRGLGTVFGSSQGYLLPSGDVVEPDVSFVSAERWSNAPDPEQGRFLRIVPDFVIEILSASTASRDRGEKLLLYAQNGVREYWTVDYRILRVSVWTANDEGRFQGPTVHDGKHDSVASVVIDGFSIPVATVFET